MAVAAKNKIPVSTRPNTLGLDGDLDDVEMIQDIEAAFGLRFDDAVLSSCSTVGELYQLVMGALPQEAQNGRGCATAFAFYRLRSVLRHFVPKTRLTPDTNMSVFQGISVRSMYRLIEERAGMRPPPKVISWQGCLLLASAVVIPAMVYAAGFPLWISMLLSVLPLLLLSAAPVCLPRNVITFGDLVQQSASRSIGTLAEQGARLGAAEAWGALVNVISDHTLLAKSDIDRETLLLARPRAAS